MATFNANIFQGYRADVERKAQTAKREVAYLYREDGRPRHTPDEHRDQMARVLAPLQQAVAEAQEYAQRAQEEAKRLEALQHADPLSSLSTDELVRLNAARELAKDEISQLTPAELSARLTAVTASDDKVSQVLHLLYARPLVQASEDSALHDKFAAIDEVVNGAQRTKAAEAAMQAEGLRKQAAELSFYASDTLGEIDGSNQAAYERKRAEYAAAF
jgi:hypothetical protein